MALRAIQDRVILEPIFGMDLSESGIFLGEGPMTHAVVLAVGPKALSLNIGDKVHVVDRAGHRTQSGRKQIMVVREDEIFAVIED